MLQQNFMPLITSLGQCNNIKELDLTNANLHSFPTSDLNRLVDMLVDNQNLVVLNLAANKLGLTAAMAKWGNILKQNKLTKLDISDNLLGCLVKDNWQHIFSGLTCSYNLTLLNIAANDLQDSEIIISLAQILWHCSNLQKLNLGYNNFTVATVVELQGFFAELIELPKLSELDLGDSLTDYLQSSEHIGMLFKFIQTTSSLTNLTLERVIPCELEQNLSRHL